MNFKKYTLVVIIGLILILITGVVVFSYNSTKRQPNDPEAVQITPTEKIIEDIPTPTITPSPTPTIRVSTPTPKIDPEIKVNECKEKEEPRLREWEYKCNGFIDSKRFDCWEELSKELYRVRDECNKLRD